jgi:tetratricopeptide (TPR) repeat protein
VFQLTKLEPEHLERILAQLRLPTQVVEWTTSALWDGDLRRLTLFEHTFTVHSRALGPVEQFRLGGPDDLYGAVTEQVGTMSATERVMVALAAADSHRIERAVLLQVTQRLLPLETPAKLNLLLDRLAGESGVLSVREGNVGLAAAELLPAIERAAGYGAARIVAEAGLRDFYVEALRGQDCAVIAPAMAMRRALSLTGRTQDPQLLISLLAECDARIAGVNDQGVYIDIVADLLQSGHDLLAFEQARLTRWAASLAYDICDFRKCRALLEQSEARDAVDVILLASCMIEDGDHSEARTILAAIDRNASAGMMLVIDVLEGTIGLDAGAWDGALRLLRRVVEDGWETVPAMAAHALRLLSELLDYPECTMVAVESVELFQAAGLPRCAAYSAMSASRYLAREGKIDEARTMIARTDVLRDHVRDEHMVRNNRALIELLTPSPDFAAIIAELQLALRTSRDDFSDLTILCNLALARAAAGALDDALDCVSRGISILDAPGFAERDVFWPICFNFGWVLDRAGRGAEAEAMRARPYRTGWKDRSSDAYWAWRYGEVAVNLDTELPYLHAFPYHPAALSHWQLDREAVTTLIEVSLL